MIIISIIAFLSLFSDCLLYYFSGLYTNWVYFWFPIVCLIGFFILYIIIYLLAVWIGVVGVNIKKDSVHINKFALWIIVQSCEMLLFVCGVKIKTTNEKILPKNGKFLIVTNHISGFDHLVLLTHLKKYYVVSIFKKEMEKTIIVGKLVHKAGFIPLDRNDPLDAMRRIRHAADLISSNEACINISPEGTRSSDEKVLPFHPGSFKIAERSKCPIVVVSLRNTDKIKNRCFRKLTTVYVDFLKTYTYDDYKDKNTIEIADEIRSEIMKDLSQSAK